MSLLVGLGLCIALGIVADLAGAAVRRVTHRGSRFRPFARFAGDVRLLVRDRDRPSATEALGVGATTLGASLASGAAIGGVGASGVLLYLSMVLASAGGHLAAATAPTSAGVARADRARAVALAAEPSFVLALGAVFLRWRTSDLEAIRGAHDVLGLGLTVGEPAVVVGLALAAVLLAVTGALRLPPEPGDEAGARGGIAVALTLTGWLLAGATALVIGALLAGATPPTRTHIGREILAQLGVAGAAALLLGSVRGMVSSAGLRAQLVVATAALAAAGLATALVLAG